jgi:hypothetical protein
VAGNRVHHPKAKELNCFNWSADETKWLLHERDLDLFVDSSTPMYPVAVPLIEDEDKFPHIEYSLKTLSQRISPHIYSGWIEIACVANEKNWYVYFQSLRIYSDGRTEKFFKCSGQIIDSCDSEQFHPSESA